MSLTKIGISFELFIAGFCLYFWIIYAVFVSQLPGYCQFLILSILFFQGRRFFRRYIFISDSRAVTAFYKHSSPFWTLEVGGEKWLHGELKNNSLITHFMMVLNFRCEQSVALTIIITPQSIGQCNFRRLMVYLLHMTTRKGKTIARAM